MAVLAGVGAYRVTRYWWLFFVAAAAPYFVAQVGWGVLFDDQGLWPVGVLFLMPLSVLPLGGAAVGRVIRDRRERRRFGQG